MPAPANVSGARSSMDECGGNGISVSISVPE
jgi:hypothetical protein